MAFNNMISLNGQELTDQGRIYTETLDKREVVVELASGLIKKYKKAYKKVFNIEWDWVPSDTPSTFDTKGARDAIRAAASTGSTMTLIVRNSILSSESIRYL